MIEKEIQRRREAESKKIRSILQQVLDVPNPRIRVEDFEKNWLNMFFGVPVEGETIPILKWVHEVSGSAYQQVDVVRGGVRYRDGQRILVRGGEVLFTVPPLLNSDAIDVKVPASGFFELIMELKDRDRQHPAEGERYMQHMIEPLFVRKEAQETFVAQMNEIAKRYGYPTINYGGQDGNKVTPSGEQPSGGAEITYESIPDF